MFHPLGGYSGPELLSNQRDAFTCFVGGVEPGAVNISLVHAGGGGGGGHGWGGSSASADAGGVFGPVDEYGGGYSDNAYGGWGLGAGAGAGDGWYVSASSNRTLPPGCKEGVRCAFSTDIYTRGCH
jgi:hypothetical protein